MKHLSILGLVLTISTLVPGSVLAGVEFTSNLTFGFPKDAILSDYGFGSISLGGTARLNYPLGKETSVYSPVVFAEIKYADFGVENGYLPLVKSSPDQGVVTASDQYLLMFSGGLAYAKRAGFLRPYIQAKGGVTYHAALSRIVNSAALSAPIFEMMENTNAAWHTGVGAGMKIGLWQSSPETASKIINNIYLDISFDYMIGGKIEYLDYRSITFGSETLNYQLSQPDIRIMFFNIGTTLVF
ncbi:hypothetical protein ACFL4X_00435 [Gemmatimonadota bacterium]